METNDIDIPPWLEDIPSTVHSLIEAGNHYSQNIVKWSELWKEKPIAGGPLEEEVSRVHDVEFKQAVEEVYIVGFSFARLMSTLLPSVLSPRYEYKLLDFTEKINQQTEKIDKHYGVLDKCKEVINEKRNYPVDYPAIRAMIELHDSQVNILENLTPDVLNIKKLAQNQMELSILNKKDTTDTL